MELDYRLRLLLDGLVISERSYKAMLKIIEMFDNKLGIKLTEEKGNSFITHLAVAYDRVEKNTTINPLAESAYDEIRKSSNYSRSQEILEIIEKEIEVYFPDSEKEYIILHLCTIL